MDNTSAKKITAPKVTSYLEGTGEIVEHSWQRVHVRYSFRGGWRAYGMVELNKVLKMGLSHAELKVALWLPVISKVGNVVIVSGKMAEAELGIERHYFSRIMSMLVKKDLVKRCAAKGCYQVNPAFAWNGSAVQHRIAREQWYQEALATRPVLVKAS